MGKLPRDSDYGPSDLDHDMSFIWLGNCPISSCKRCMDRGIRIRVWFYNVNVPLLQSNRLAVKVQRAATENKSHGSSCLAKQRQRRRDMACEGGREGGREPERKAERERKGKRAARETAKGWMKQGTNNNENGFTDGKKEGL